MNPDMNRTVPGDSDTSCPLITNTSRTEADTNGADSRVEQDSVTECLSLLSLNGADSESAAPVEPTSDAGRLPTSGSATGVPDSHVDKEHVKNDAKEDTTTKSPPPTTVEEENVNYWPAIQACCAKGVKPIVECPVCTTSLSLSGLTPPTDTDIEIGFVLPACQHAIGVCCLDEWTRGKDRHHLYVPFSHGDTTSSIPRLPGQIPTCPICRERISGQTLDSIRQIVRKLQGGIPGASSSSSDNNNVAAAAAPAGTGVSRRTIDVPAIQQVLEASIPPADRDELLSTMRTGEQILPSLMPVVRGDMARLEAARDAEPLVPFGLRIRDISVEHHASEERGQITVIYHASIDVAHSVQLDIGSGVMVPGGRSVRFSRRWVYVEGRNALIFTSVI